MPARKPKGLIQRHDTKEEQQARADREAAFETGIELPKTPPAELKGYPVASKVWRRLMREFSSIEDSYVASLDRDMLVSYCMALQQLEELTQMRKKAYSLWMHHTKAFDKSCKVNGEDSDLTEELAIQVSGAFGTVVKLDARSDQKRKMIFDLQKSLYMTPRSRAGATPDKLSPPEEPDDMEKLLSQSDQDLLDKATEIMTGNGE